MPAIATQTRDTARNKSKRNYVSKANRPTPRRRAAPLPVKSQGQYLSKCSSMSPLFALGPRTYRAHVKASSSLPPSHGSGLPNYGNTLLPIYQAYRLCYRSHGANPAAILHICRGAFPVGALRGTSRTSEWSLFQCIVSIV